MNEKRITISVSDAVHQQIKAMASLKGQSIKDFILDKVFPNHNIPNAETLKAMQESIENKNMKTFKNAKELFDDLGI